MKVMKFWFTFTRGLPVTFHFQTRDHTVLWKRLYGVQIGQWFIGVVASSDDMSVERRRT